MKGIAIALGLVMAAMTRAPASELKLIAGGSLAGLFKQLGPQFEKASGHTLSIHFDSTPNIISRINAGTPFDVVVVPVDVFKDAAAKGHLRRPRRSNIARVGYGVIVRAGAPKPDLSTPDAFKKALLAASSVASVPASAAGAYVAKVYERLGIADEMKAKTKVQALPTHDRAGRRQRRSRARHLPDQCVQRARHRARRPLPGRSAAGAGVHRRGRRRRQGSRPLQRR